MRSSSTYDPHGTFIEDNNIKYKEIGAVDHEEDYYSSQELTRKMKTEDDREPIVPRSYQQSIDWFSVIFTSSFIYFTLLNPNTWSAIKVKRRVDVDTKVVSPQDK